MINEDSGFGSERGFEVVELKAGETIEKTVSIVNPTDTFTATLFTIV